LKVSGSATLDGHPLIPGHTEAIEALRASTLDWTVVSPSFAMETALGVQARLFAATGAMCGCTAREPLSLVAAGDVARASLAVLDDEGPAGADFELTGPDALPLEEVARSVAHATGRPVPYRELTEPELRQALVDAGFPEQQVDFQLIVQFRAIRAGGSAKVTDGVEQLTGSRPIGLGQFLATEGSGLFARAG
jgi:NAD(P)H dehydrogenase (quinone)